MDKQEFRLKAKKGIDDIFNKINELEAKKNIVKDEVKVKYNERIKELKIKKADLLKNYNCLIESADEKWEETKIMFTKALDSIKGEFVEIKAFFKK